MDNPLTTERFYRADGSPRPLGVIGYPIKHSLSPIFQNVALAHHRLPHHYEKWEVKPHELVAFLERAKQDDFLGLNVTVPHKRTAWEEASWHSQEAEGSGAVNTLRLDEETGDDWLGHNTDVDGLIEALEEKEFEVDGQIALIIGAGGAARAAVYGLQMMGIRQIAIANRTFDNAQELADELSSEFPECPLTPLSLEIEDWSDFAKPFGLVINATSQGLIEPQAQFVLDLAKLNVKPQTLFFDLTYGETPFLKAARQQNQPTLDGLSMLVYQGALAFEWWTGLAAPRDKMLQAARAALTERERQAH